jgi:catechol-2,3-dioxygenase
MLQVKRIGHATLTTPDLERQLDYYTRVVGLSAVAKEKDRAILATKPGQEAIVLERGDRPAGVRLAFQVAPGSDLGELSARLSKAGIKSERRSSITPGIAQAIVFTDPKGTSVEIFSTTPSPKMTTPIPASCRASSATSPFTRPTSQRR